MRILFLSHRHSDTTIGGLAEFLHFLPKSLRDLGVESFLYTRSIEDTDQLQAPEILSNQMPHYTGPFLKPAFFTNKNELRPLLQLCKTEKIEMIHAQGTYRAGWMAMRLSQQLNIPYMITSHSDILEINSERMRRNNIKRRCQKVLKNADFVTHLSPVMENASNQLYDANTKSKIIHNGIDLTNWHNPLNKTEKDYILAIGRLEPEKGFHVLIDAYHQLRKNNCRTSLVIAGVGSKEKELQIQAKNLGLNVITDFHDFNHLPEASVIFTGYVRAEEKKNLFLEAKIILFATQPKEWEEAFGIVQLEAMAAKKPLIVSDMTITRYLQALGMNAKLVAAEDATTWANTINSLLTDASLRINMGEKNRLIAEKFTWQLIAKEYADVYSSLLLR